MRKLPIVVLAVVAAAGLVSAPSARAVATTKCSGTYPVTISPGFGSEPSSGVFHSGRKGKIVCSDGRRGTIEVDGRYGVADPDSCSKGLDGWGVHSIKLNGKSLRNTATFEGGGLKKALFLGQFDGELLTGTYTFAPVKGDCLTKPVTQGNLRFEAVLTR